MSEWWVLVIVLGAGLAGIIHAIDNLRREVCACRRVLADHIARTERGVPVWEEEADDDP